MSGNIKSKLNSTRIIALGFLILILIGSLLLSLPISTRSRTATPYIDSLFTSVSATCVTGLIQYDTFTHWSYFGQAVILALIQIGGIGFMTVLTLFSLFLKRKIGLYERKLLMDSAGTMRISGVVILIRRILIGTAIIESVGAVLLALRFIPKLGVLQGIWHSIFMSVSAFCNAGFDLLGHTEKFSSLCSVGTDPVICITIMLMIILGGLGFIVWGDLITNRFNFKKLSLHSKIALSAAAFLIFIPAILFLILEWNSSMAGMNTGEKILSSFFAAVSPRTAGFNSVDLTELSEGGSLITMVLMLIGGSPGSTAGGIKTTTAVLLISVLIASIRQKPHVNIFKRRIDSELANRAFSILTIYILAVIIGSVTLCALQPFSIKEVLFETISAVGTVGLTLGITPQLCAVSKIVIMILMFAGRIGGLTLALVLSNKRKNAPVSRPHEKILIG